jgi:hypothetical protein
MCGNGVVEADEECDGDAFGGKNCITEGFDGGLLTCNMNCTLNTDGCSVCGDGKIGQTEQCDGMDLGGYNCGNLGCSGGTLKCDPVTCTLDTTLCTGC